MKEIYDKLQERGQTYFNQLASNRALPIVSGNEVLFLHQDSERPIREMRLVHHVSTLDRAPKFIPLSSGGPLGLHLILPECARLEYTFGISYQDGGEEIRIDPRNPIQAWCPFGPKSVVATSGYHTPSWAKTKESVPRGTLTSASIVSRIFEDQRTLMVYTPAVPPPKNGYPAILVHDGPDYIHYAGMANVLDNLIATHKIAPVVALLSQPVNRNEEYACMLGHARFIAEELIPWAQNHYPLCKSRESLAIMGSSFGGVASVFTAHHFPELFGKMLIQSGSFRFQDIISKRGIFEPMDAFDRIKLFLETEYLANKHPARMQIFQTCGTFEPLMWYNRNFSRHLKAAGHRTRYRESNDGHNWVSWRDHLGEGLNYLFPPSSESSRTQKRPLRRTMEAK